MLTYWLLAFAASATLAGQEPPPIQRTQEPATRLEDVVVAGRPLDSLVAEFVSEVAAPARHRGLARWQGEICVGVVNLRAPPAQAIADRISQVGMDLGLRPGEPGCRASIIIIFTADASSLTDMLGSAHRRAFRSRTGVQDRGNTAFDEFLASERPVRWWHVSMPVNSETGRRAVRLPGDYDPRTGNPTSPTASVFAASRLNTQIRDDLRKVMVIVDIDMLGSVHLAQLADYLALVSLAQIDGDADTKSHDTILNLFDPAASVDGLTEWDRSYLHSLYRVLNDPQRPINPSGQASRVAGVMSRERQQGPDDPIQE